MHAVHLKHKQEVSSYFQHTLVSAVVFVVAVGTLKTSIADDRHLETDPLTTVELVVLAGPL